MKLINIFKLKTDFYELNFPESTPLHNLKMFITQSTSLLFFLRLLRLPPNVHGTYLQIKKWVDVTLGGSTVLEF